MDEEYEGIKKAFFVTDRDDVFDKFKRQLSDLGVTVYRYRTTDLDRLPVTDGAIIIDSADDIDFLYATVEGLHLRWQNFQRMPYIIALASYEAFCEAGKSHMWVVNNRAAVACIIDPLDPFREGQALMLRRVLGYP